MRPTPTGSGVDSMAFAVASNNCDYFLAHFFVSLTSSLRKLQPKRFVCWLILPADGGNEYPKAEKYGNIGTRFLVTQS
jgi:hypothetical protein